MIPGIGSWLTKRTILTPDKEAVVEGEKRLTYRQLNGRVNRLAKALQSLGLKSGDRLSILSTNCVEYVETIMAAAKLGVLLVPLNWRLTPTELTFILKDSGTETLLFHPDLLETAEILREKAGLKRMVVLGSEERGGAFAYEQIVEPLNDDEPAPDVLPGLDTPHIIMYTAG
ncbi:MAG TPA: AMP-binding protein, partial [Deltaproteobacteria bacterium]|nr:AMP-binding protein [Deltaproteobacteria bacterium]